MIHGLKPYPAYKNSGVPWLGTVPVHWEIERAKWLFRKMSRPVPEDSEVVTCFRDGVVTLRKNRRIRGFTEALKEIGYQGIHRGDLVIHAMDAFAGAVGVADSDGKGTPVYSVCEPSTGANSHYYAYVIREMARSQWVLALAKGVRERSTDFRFDDFSSQSVALPALPEQSAAVRFLDHADQRIRHYIRAKNKLIMLLNEQRQAMIHHAVTHGLDADVRLKASTLDGLGGVPEHWRECLLGRCLSRIEQGWSPVAAEGEVSPDQWSVLTLSAVKRGHFDALAVKPIPLSARVPDGIEVSDGDLLLTRSNSRERVGDVCIVESARPKMVICDLIYRLVVDPTVFVPRFLMYQLLSGVGRRQIEADARGSNETMPKLAQRHIRAWKVVVPSLYEQRMIIEATDNVMNGINEAVRRVEVEIDLLYEYKARLISDVVTGKLDVREAAVRLPAGSEEPETSGMGDTLEGDGAVDGADPADSYEESDA